MTEFIERKCPICGVRYCLDREFWDYRQRGGTVECKAAAWYCPNGHILVIRESDADVLRRENQRLTQRIAQKDDEIWDERKRAQLATRTASAYKGQATKLRQRAKAGVCPCCKRSFKALAAHMATKHPNFPAEAPEPALETT